MTDIDPGAIHPHALVGAPGQGTHGVGEVVMDAAGGVWQCTVAGTPGTWAQLNAGVVRCARGSVARTNTTAKALFTLPAGAIITRVALWAAVASDAETTAVVSVGKSGSAAAYLDTQDVQSAAGVVDTGAKITLGSIGASAVAVQAIYAETGTASTTGGPWDVYVEYVTN